MSSDRPRRWPDLPADPEDDTPEQARTRVERIERACDPVPALERAATDPASSALLKAKSRASLEFLSRRGLTEASRAAAADALARVDIATNHPRMN